MTIQIRKLYVGLAWHQTCFNHRSTNASITYPQSQDRLFISDPILDTRKHLVSLQWISCHVVILKVVDSNWNKDITNEEWNLPYTRNVSDFFQASHICLWPYFLTCQTSHTNSESMQILPHFHNDVNTEEGAKTWKRKQENYYLENLVESSSQMCWGHFRIVQSDCDRGKSHCNS